MTVITVAATDPGEVFQRWEVPTDRVLNNTPIPRGIRAYGGSKPIPLLGSGDETNFLLTLTFPSQFVYLPKTFTLSFVSDDITSEFNNLGLYTYRPRGLANETGVLGIRRDFTLKSEGAAIRGAIKSNQAYVPMGTWRQWINGPQGDDLIANIVDMSGDASTAGDVIWFAEFLEYDIEQCFKWPVNTPLPVLNY